MRNSFSFNNIYRHRNILACNTEAKKNLGALEFESDLLDRPTPHWCIRMVHLSVSKIQWKHVRSIPCLRMSISNSYVVRRISLLKERQRNRLLACTKRPATGRFFMTATQVGGDKWYRPIVPVLHCILYRVVLHLIRLSPDLFFTARITLCKCNCCS
ncbi:hypothetical protein C5167_002072 [Papaver somniferum]|uniref:Uncharacterized protein n=1 Tax=Papaver somniferum TaxID=3469 RepID=A0A4Y7L0N2_PAPSO|nr:hypothetical protein C5167_002072 [Papaver somniferum]